MVAGAGLPSNRQSKIDNYWFMPASASACRALRWTFNLRLDYTPDYTPVRGADSG